MVSVKGIHHVTAITSSAEKIYEFFTYTLGMRLVKKTVNQDDIKTYHLFFADDKGNAGTDMTFFDFPGLPQGTHGTDEIYRSTFRVPTNESLNYWKNRFNRLGVKNKGITEEFGVKTLEFEDFDEQQYALVSDEGLGGVATGTPWQKGPIPLEHAITGLGPITIRVKDFDHFKKIMEDVMYYKQIATEDSFHLFEVGEGGNGGRVIVEHNDKLPWGRQGFGTIHHAAFRVNNREEIGEWNEHLREEGIPTSGFVERHFFQSLYARMIKGVLFEWATDGPGFMGDEDYETLGEKLSLPPFLEPKREMIESQVRHIDTVRSTKIFIKN